jgi:peptidoglycan hydrolase-like protein with peptidoglycan-binding domain
MSIQEDRQIVVAGWQSVVQRPPKLFEAQVVHGFAMLESGFGRAWRGAGAGSFNMVAVQASGPPCDPRYSFPYDDTHPNEDGSSTAYHACFKKYTSPHEGIADAVRVAITGRPSVREAIKSGSELAVSAAMFTSGFYEGFGPDEDDRIVNHYKALITHMQRTAALLGEKMPRAAHIILPFDVSKPTLRFGSTGNFVKEWQRLIGSAADGIFGKTTVALTRGWQQQHGLVADGVVGSASWSRAAEEAKDTEPPEPPPAPPVA